MRYRDGGHQPRLCADAPEAAALDQLNTVYNPGGVVQTNVHGSGADYWIELIGNATTTHLIDVPETALHQGRFGGAQIAETGEEAAYQRFVATLLTATSSPQSKLS